MQQSKTPTFLSVGELAKAIVAAIVQPKGMAPGPLGPRPRRPSEPHPLQGDEAPRRGGEEINHHDDALRRWRLIQRAWRERGR